MASQQFLVVVQPIVITSYELNYMVRASSQEEAEEIFRNPEKYRGRLQLVKQERHTNQASRETVPVLVYQWEDQLETTPPSESEQALPGE